MFSLSRAASCLGINDREEINWAIRERKYTRTDTSTFPERILYAQKVFRSCGCSFHPRFAHLRAERRTHAGAVARFVRSNCGVQSDGSLRGREAERQRGHLSPARQSGRHTGQEMEFETADGHRHHGTVVRMKSCFGRGLLIFATGEAKLGVKDEFVLRFPEKN
jgi:hypothetical protein